MTVCLAPGILFEMFLYGIDRVEVQYAIAELCKETAEPVFLTKDGHTVDEVSAYLDAVIAEGAAISGEK